MNDAIRKFFAKEVLIALGFGALGGWAGPTFLFSIDDRPAQILADKVGIHQLCFGPESDASASSRFFVTLPFDRPCRIKGEIEYKRGNYRADEHSGTQVVPTVDKFDYTDHVADIWLIHQELDVWRPIPPGEFQPPTTALPFRPTTLRSVTLDQLKEWGVLRVRLEIYRADRIKGADDDIPEVIEWKAQ